MLKFNKSTMIALYAMMELARDPQATLATTEIAERFHASRHHLAKVLQQLVREGLVTAVRGASGGHRIARDPKDVTLLDVVRVFERPRHQDGHCLLAEAEQAGTDALGNPRGCSLHPVFAELDEQVCATLESISLKTLVSVPRL